MRLKDRTRDLLDTPWASEEPCCVTVDGGAGREWLVEQRYRAVLEVLDGSPVGDAISYRILLGDRAIGFNRT